MTSKKVVPIILCTIVLKKFHQQIKGDRTDLAKVRQFIHTPHQNCKKFMLGLRDGLIASYFNA